MASAPAPQAPRLRLWGAALLAAGARPFAPERRYQLLALLGLQAGEWVERDRLAALLWPGHPLAEARRNLRKVIFRAHEVPGAQDLQTSDHALCWPVTTDLQAFDAALRAGDPEAALAWRRGVPLEGIDDPANAVLAERLAAERARLEQAWLAAALEQVQAAADPRAKLRAARRVLEVDPLDEGAMRALLQALQALGQGAEAQAEYRRFAGRLAQELGVEPSRSLREVLLAPAGAAGTGAARRAGDAFVGRRLEAARALALLAAPAARMLTLLGPGGIGKSRLARHLLPSLAPSFAAGAQWVELQDLDDLAALPARLAQVWGLALADRGDPLAPLLRQLPPGRRLLVLDNAEHLEGLPPLLQGLLGGAPDLVLLVTSRRRLGLAAEQVLMLAGLEVPDDESHDLEAAASFDAVRLFAQCAQGAQRNFRLEDHLPAAIAIVQAVGGMPLAIELAAAWVRLLPPAQVAQDLRGSIDLLERDPAARRLPARPEHASLRAVLEGSWRLLGPREREALAALSVFEGGFTRAAALAVAGCSLPLLSSLVDKSLLTVDETGRFAFHPVVAAHAAERRRDDPAGSAAASARHAAHFVRWLAELNAPGVGDRRALAAGVRTEFANVLAAWRHAVAHEAADQVAAALPALRRFFEGQGRLVEGITLLRAALARAWPAQVQALIRHAVASLLYRKGDLEDARAIAEAGLAAAQAGGDRRLQADTLMVVASCLSSAGRPAEARPLFEQALSLLQALGERAACATAFSHLGVLEKKLGRFDAALERYAAALSIDRELGEIGNMAIRLNNIAGVHMEREHWDLARRSFQDARRLPLEEVLPWAVAYIEYGLGVSQLELGALESARRHLAVARERAMATDLATIATAAEVGLARVAAAQGDLAGGLVRLQAAAARCRVPDLLEEQLSLALYYGEWLRRAGRPAQAARVWQTTAQHPATEVGLRRSAERWIAALEPGAVSAAPPPSLDEVFEMLQHEGAQAPGNGEETPPA